MPARNSSKTSSVFEIYATKQPVSKVTSVQGIPKLPELRNAGKVKVTDFGSAIVIRRIKL